jgi:hypothetical protein
LPASRAAARGDTDLLPLRQQVLDDRQADRSTPEDDVQLARRGHRTGTGARTGLGSEMPGAARWMSKITPIAISQSAQTL